MSESTLFMAKASRTLEQRKPVFHFRQDMPGFSFTHEFELTIPHGKYLLMETDSRDPRRAVIMNAHTYEMYAVLKRFVPSND